MLILCSGEDTYRSLEKARELEAAFRTKFDPAGSAVDRLSSGKDGIDELLSRATAASLFSPKRFFRATDLVSSCPKAKFDALVRTLERDVEGTIVVSVEAGELTAKALKPFASLPKLVHYPFPLMTPAEFKKWALEYASKNGIKEARAVSELVNIAQGDTWTFVNEFMKLKAGGSVATENVESPSLYDVIDHVLTGAADRWSVLRAFDDAPSVVSTAFSQARSLVLVQSGNGASVHPYAAQKLSRLRVADPPLVFERLLTALIWSRTSQASAEEALDVLIPGKNA
jgi:hypothetical protein